MKDKVFIDTNIFVYSFLDTDDSDHHCKHLKAVDFLKQFGKDSQVIISTQVLSEYYSLRLRSANRSYAGYGLGDNLSAI